MDKRNGDSAWRWDALWRRRSLFLLCAGLTLFLPSAAHAQFHVAQPDVVKGEATAGDHAAIYQGPGTKEKLDQGHEVEATYDFTERWGLVGKGIF